MKVQVKIKQTYGRDNIYPANETALLFTRIIGNKTFSKQQLRLIKELGYEIEPISQTTEELIGV